MSKGMHKRNADRWTHGLLVAHRIGACSVVWAEACSPQSCHMWAGVYDNASDTFACMQG